MSHGFCLPGLDLSSLLICMELLSGIGDIGLMYNMCKLFHIEVEEKILVLTQAYFKNCIEMHGPLSEISVHINNIKRTPLAISVLFAEINHPIDIAQLRHMVRVIFNLICINSSFNCHKKICSIAIS